MKRPVKHTVIYTLILLVSVGFAFFWTKNEVLLNMSLQFISLLVIIYVGIQFAARKMQFSKTNKIVIDVILLTLTTYLIVFSTGALFSPLFFLIYFLLFGISLLFEPSSAIALAIISTVFFLFTAQKEIFAELLQLVSLFLITPLALIFGTQYMKLLQDEEKIKILSLKGEELEKEVNEQETEVKTWTEGEFKNQLIKIWESIEALASDPACKGLHKQKLTEVSGELSKLLQSGKKMEEKIES
ncbi:hypothetical protein A2V55_01875 [Candidatus Woesebacteria bacterium RBG_19FT_COMBO_37_29]|uniref:Uncharacterized protein n=1 Tax=Candidatus Woesebacteria bacterium RBG_19FT_COMBO_37_29 TaxID=1802486 RepID=A0A1F7XP99_9BACT|nr:MAG: hypothetical protein A2V55_01875 [Candidatus Woesebacteria bacterium RBG_19FT_COMBO_37_29]